MGLLSNDKNRNFGSLNDTQGSAAEKGVAEHTSTAAGHDEEIRSRIEHEFKDCIGHALAGTLASNGDFTADMHVREVGSEFTKPAGTDIGGGNIDTGSDFAVEVDQGIEDPPKGKLAAGGPSEASCVGHSEE